MRGVKQNCLVLFVKMDVALFFLLAFDLQIATSTIEDLNLENSRLKSLASLHTSPYRGFKNSSVSNSRFPLR